jgi:hypothetical protein
MPEAPTLSAEQRRAAHERSLAVRQARADIKRDIAQQGVSYLVNAFRLWWPEDSGYAAFAGMKVYDLLTALPAVGPAKATALLEKAGIPLKNTVRACGPRQTERLFSLLQRS